MAPQSQNAICLKLFDDGYSLPSATEGSLASAYESVSRHLRVSWLSANDVRGEIQRRSRGEENFLEVRLRLLLECCR